MRTIFISYIQCLLKIKYSPVLPRPVLVLESNHTMPRQMCAPAEKIWVRTIAMKSIYIYIYILWLSSSYSNIYINDGVVPKLRSVIAGFSPRRPRIDSKLGYMTFILDKVALGRYLTEYLGPPANSHETNASCSSVIRHLFCDIRNGLPPLQENREKNGYWQT
jgi:hypothetical protein